MQRAFHTLADELTACLRGDEVLLCSLSAERSDFVRLNDCRVRQAGSVLQGSLGIELIDKSRHVSASYVLSGDGEVDRARGAALISELREQLPYLPEDPHLMYNREVRSTEMRAESDLPPSTDAIHEIIRAGEGLDLVGIWAAGDVMSGFANSLGQRNWFESRSFHFDWSVYQSGDKATKCGYAGARWSTEELRRRMEQARAEVEALSRAPRTIARGEYRVYLAPAALCEITDLMSWDGFGLKAQRSKISPLMKAVAGEASLDPRVSLYEHAAAGRSPAFDSKGFIKPPKVSLVEGGAYRDSLVSARSAAEYGVETTGANGGESPTCLEMNGGTLAASEILKGLGTGLWINNLWYLNYSDRPACRMTGMTRFATLWVENGEIVAPVNVMRFDDSVFRILGEGLVDLSAEPELMLSARTYGQRDTGSSCLPGALVDGFRLTL